MTTEATIVVNGHTLTPAQAMTLRRALEAFLDEMRLPDILGCDELGRNLALAFTRRCEEIHALIHQKEHLNQQEHLFVAFKNVLLAASSHPSV